MAAIQAGAEPRSALPGESTTSSYRWLSRPHDNWKPNRKIWPDL